MMLWNILESSVFAVAVVAIVFAVVAIVVAVVAIVVAVVLVDDSSLKVPKAGYMSISCTEKPPSV